MKSKSKTRRVGLLLVCFFALCNGGGDGCLVPPLTVLSEDYFIRNYESSYDTLIVGWERADNKNVSFYVSAIGRTLEKAPYASTPTYFEYDKDGNQFDTNAKEKFNSLARKFGDTLFLGKLVEIFLFSSTFPIVSVDPITQMKVQCTRPYRGSKEVTNEFNIYVNKERRSISYFLNIDFFEVGNTKWFDMVDRVSYDREYYVMKDDYSSMLQGRKLQSLIEFNKEEKAEGLVEFGHFTLKLEGFPYESGNYEFEITATTKSGKVLKTKTAPVYLVGENE